MVTVVGEGPTDQRLDDVPDIDAKHPEQHPGGHQNRRDL
jgi:hypothetical protein